MYQEFAAANQIPAINTASTASDWEAELKLGFIRSGDKTLLATRKHSGPLNVQRPFYPEGGLSHVYLLHPPGGVVGGDRLTIEANLDSRAQTLITTPAAGKFYRSGGGTAQQNVRLKVAEQATLEWLPQETIVYEGARLNSCMNIDLAIQSAFIGWEVLAMGRPAAGEGFDSGEVCLNWRINLAGQLFYKERLRLDAKAFAARWGLNGQSACGTLFAYPANKEHLTIVQDLIGEHPGRGVTRIDDLLICRAIDDRADRLRDFFQQIWQVIRNFIINRPACQPRIWAT